MGVVVCLNRNRKLTSIFGHVLEFKLGESALIEALLGLGVLSLDDALASGLFIENNGIFMGISVVH